MVVSGDFENNHKSITMADLTQSPAPVRCPGCGAVLRPKVQPKPTQYITCPVCKSRHTFAEYLPYKQQPAQGGAKRTAAFPGVIVYMGTRYHLAAGRNIVGREADTSKATLRLPDQSRYMSREHFSIDVTPMSDGTMRHTISLIKDLCQPSVVNGTQLTTGNALILRHGDKISITPANCDPIELTFLDGI